MDFAVSADHRVNIKDNEQINNYLDLSREHRKLWNIRAIAIQIMIGVLRTVLKGLEMRLADMEIKR